MVGSIVVQVDDLEREAAFWPAALGDERRLADPEGDRLRWVDASR